MTHEPTPKGKHRFSQYFYNSVTYFGVILSIVVLLFELFLFTIDLVSPNQSVYLGIFTYILLPPFLILGLILIPLGARWKQEKVLKGLVDKKPKIIHIDPTLASHQNAILIFIIGTIILLVMTAVGSYKAFHYTESVEFCGAACHQIMKPEYTLYKQSPHAKIKCVECHIGGGADWYVKYKLAGARMLLKTFDGTYARPVPAPVENLRPAKETCEQCHWPGKSFNAIEKNKTYYSTDSTDNPAWHLKMLMKVGGQDKQNMGIHAHMYNSNDMYYVADDDKRQKISWIKSVSKDGQETIYMTKDSAYQKTPPDPKKIKKMDCMDCHNRPSHHYNSPVKLLDIAMNEGKINPSIPMIKSKAVEVLAKKYKTTSEATEGIRQTLSRYYQEKQSDYYANHTKEINDTIEQITLIYQNNFFPEMNARWDDYPDNASHLIFQGCFRCHDGEHISKDQKVITKDCNACHTIVEQGPSGAVEKNIDGLEFKHPFNDDGSWKEMSCSDCHSGS